MFLTREPCARLRPFVKKLWAVNNQFSVWSGVADRERMLPTGDMHIAIRLGDEPIRLFADINDPTGEVLGQAVIGGARSTFYVRDIAQPTCTVGAQIHAVAARLLFGMPAGELAGRHTRLGDVWGPCAGALRERLIEVSTLEGQVELLESELVNRLRHVRTVHPAVAHALERLPLGFNVRQVVQETGYSHRRFISLFREEMGLTPKLFCRLLRFQRIMQQFAQDASAPWSALAYDAGYSDQSHFTRDFHEFAGVQPEVYRRCYSNPSAGHIPVLRRSATEVNFIQDDATQRPL
jgi:AraC-like DNA-binding protein